MGRIVAVDECPKSRKLGDHVGTGCKASHAGAPGRAALRRKIFQHACMLQDEGDVRTSLRETGGVSHLRRKHLQVKAQAVVGEAGNIAMDQGIGAEIGARRKAVEGIFVPV